MAVVAAAAEQLLPLEQLVHKAEVGLDDDVEAAGADEAVGARKRETAAAHDLGDADGGAARDADAAVHERRGAPFAPAVCLKTSRLLC